MPVHVEPSTIDLQEIRSKLYDGLGNTFVGQVTFKTIGAGLGATVIQLVDTGVRVKALTDIKVLDQDENMPDGLTLLDITSDPAGLITVVGNDWQDNPYLVFNAAPNTLGDPVGYITALHVVYGKQETLFDHDMGMLNKIISKLSSVPRLILNVIRDMKWHTPGAAVWDDPAPATLQEVEDARGTEASLDARLSVMLEDDGTFKAVAAGDGLGIDGSGGLEVKVDTSHMGIVADTVRVVDGGISTAKLKQTLGSEAVTTATIRDLAVTTDKVNDLAVTTGKINNLAVTAGKLAASSVEEAKIDGGAVTSGKIAANAVVSSKFGSVVVSGCVDDSHPMLDPNSLLLQTIYLENVTDLILRRARFMLSNSSGNLCKFKVLAVGHSSWTSTDRRGDNSPNVVLYNGVADSFELQIYAVTAGVDYTIDQADGWTIIADVTY